MGIISYKDVLEAMRRIEGTIVRTPVLTCPQADEITGRQIFFKSEHLQTTGSFKARGALNAVTSVGIANF